MIRRRRSIDTHVAWTCIALAIVGCAPTGVTPKVAEDAVSTARTGGSGTTPSATNPGQTGTATGQTGTTTKPGTPTTPVVGGDVPSMGVSLPGGAAEGFMHKDESNQYDALKNVAPVPVSAAAGLTWTSPDGLQVTIPPGALNADGQLRIRRIDNTDRPITAEKIPGMSYWMDLGGATVGLDKVMKVKGPVDDKFIEALKAKDPNFDANKYNLSQEDGKWMLTMGMEGPRSTEIEPSGQFTPFYTTVDIANRSFLPVTVFTATGPETNTGFKLMGAEGQDHTDGYKTFDDLDIDTIRQWIPEQTGAVGYDWRNPGQTENVRGEADAYWSPIDTTRVKTRDANGNVIELDAGSVDPVTGKWQIKTGTSSFNPTTHQQNCDFADAGCPDSGAVAQVLARYNHILSSRFPTDMIYAANLVDYDGNPSSLAGTPHPAAGRIKRPPATLMAVVEKYRTLGNACDISQLHRVYAKAIWKSDIDGIHLQPARGTNVDFASLDGNAGGEVNVRKRVRPVDDAGIAFEQMRGLYGLTAYYTDTRNVPSGQIVGPSYNGQVDTTKDYSRDPQLVYVPRYSPEVQVNIVSEDFPIKENDQLELSYKIDDGPVQIARQIIPADPNILSDLPKSEPVQLVLNNANGLAARPFKFYAKIPTSFNFAPGLDPAHKLTFSNIKMRRVEGGQLTQLPIAPNDVDLRSQAFIPNTASSGVWINGHYRVYLKIRSVAVK